ncbi:DNA repair protein RecO [Sphingopyxis yananensis]|uniref:DNA repair protein RecO n=1 Tax=Sphingopyxis yananensis TaxID=2886687 RepID=UPI001D117AEC|nr:DNA repair protein RecO [Sphingopyxis yananensis]MCC2600937.1 DNA repair protein RecO [Sphingopyxis yananensis]
MASINYDAMIVSVRQHGEHGAIVRALTREAGIVAGYVRGGRSRQYRPILMAGNAISLDLRSRTEGQLGSMTAELLISRAPCLNQALSAAALDWLTSLTAATLPEAQPYPMIYDALSATLDAVMVAASARQWAAALTRYELLLLAELGFGLNLTNCVISDQSTDLSYLSPRSGGAVSDQAARGYEKKLFHLPNFLKGMDRDPPMRDVMDGLLITGHFLERDLMDGRMRELGNVRLRLIERLHRAVA